MSRPPVLFGSLRAETLAKRWQTVRIFLSWVLAVAILPAFFFSNPAAASQDQSKSGQSSNASSKDRNEIGPAKLFEAVSGYIDGFHRNPSKDSKENLRGRKEQRRGFSQAKTGDGEPRRVLKKEEDLARARMQRQEWELAVDPLESALKGATYAASSDDTSRLKLLLQAAQGNAGKASQDKSPTPGEVINSIGMRLVLIPAGSFTMGSSEAEIRRIQNDWNVQESLIQREGPAHKVRISRPFFLGKYHVTAGQFKRFVQETGYRTVAEKQGWGWVYDDSKKHWAKKPSASWRNPGTEAREDYPVSLVCHEDAEAFCQWLSKKEQRQYHLPTEAQWEYAARGGKEGERYTWGDEYPDGKRLNVADRNSPVPWADRTLDDGHARLAPVGSYEPNSFWLYDMLGNAWQLCSDLYDPKAYEEAKSALAVDPTGPRRGKKKVARGGCWAFGAGIARNAFRFGIDPDTGTDMSGFRVAVVAAPDETPQSGADDRNQQEALWRHGQVTPLMDRVKDLVAKGRRIEALRVIEKASAAGSKETDLAEETNAFAKRVLEALVDVTGDKSGEAFTNSLGMKMIRIPSGAFVMGSSEADISWAMGALSQGQPVNLENEFPFHKVRISRPFFMSSTEVTVAQFREFVNETGYITDAEDEKGGQVFNTESNQFERKAGTSWKNPGWTISSDQPVTMVSHNDAQAFVEWLTAKEKVPYKLPTEAQWEYAARGGLPMAQFPWGDALPDGRRANYADKNTDFAWRDRTADDGFKYVAPVGSYEPNGFGLYDMGGNVLEWVRDYYREDYYRFSPEVDPEGPGHGENRVMKGGEWTFGPVNLRCAFRGWARPDLAFYNSGFRVIIEMTSPQRTFHFADDFLTKSWVPGPDQRAVASAMAKEKERQAKVVPADRATGSKTLPAPHVEPVSGVVVLDFTPKSDAKKAGMARGDVIIEYHGVRDLTAEKFLALTAKTKRDKTHPVAVFVRDGYEYSLRLPSGSIGISVMDTTVKGPFKKPEPRPDRAPTGDKDQKSQPQDWT
ncbi:MAG: SUMF1/EgtB/PvdO family nonheme iron enzyme [Desulfomonile tiedjei]|nr:SUMF1/EgtB/PvdO family nonheme iron enzyme [Desulfomonile tiedjei]